MNVLVLTPLYCVGERNDLIQDTSAIHYLVKYWAEENQVLVIDTYLNYRNKLHRYLKRKNRKYYREDYTFVKDGIKIYIIENQILTKGRFVSWNWSHCRRHIKRILGREKFVPDIVISHFPCYSYGFIDKLGIDAPKIAVVHESDVVNAVENSEFYNALEDKYSAVYCRSKKILNFFNERGLSNLKKDIIYSGAPKDTDVPQKNWDDFRTRTIDILFVGKLIKRKNVDWIMRALSSQRTHRFHLTVVGKGPEEENIKVLAGQLGLDALVTFIQSLSREQVLQKMDKADIFCMPSINETFGLVYIEALSRGCLTIGTKNEGIDGVINNLENGFLVGNYEELVNCLENIFNFISLQEIEEISKKAIDTGINFSEENVSKRYFEYVTNYQLR